MEKEKKSIVRLYDVHRNYKILSEVGSGTYGRVYKAQNIKTNKFVALKKIDMSRQEMDGFPITAIREIKLLKMLDHKNIIPLLEIIISKPSVANKFRGSTFLVFDYMDHDFVGLMTIKYKFKLPEIKNMMYQMFTGLKYLHERKIIHRDIKSGNILLNNNGEVKIADFGLARQFHSPQNMFYTNKVVTLWYRAPELLLGSVNYNAQIDIWSMGCIFAELLTGEILFKGDKESRQLELIFEMCGSPDKESWPDAEKLSYYNTLGPKSVSERKITKYIKDKVHDIDEITVDLLDKLLILDPKKRITTEQALNHNFFFTDPLPCPNEKMPKIEKECHETLLKNKKRQNKPEEETNPKLGKQENENNESNFSNRPYSNYYNYKEKSFEKNLNEISEKKKIFMTSRGGYKPRNNFYKNKFNYPESYKFHKYSNYSNYNSKYRKYKDDWSPKTKEQDHENHSNEELSEKIKKESEVTISNFQQNISEANENANFETRMEEAIKNENFQFSMAGGLKSLIQNSLNYNSSNNNNYTDEEKNKKRKREEKKEEKEFVLKKLKYE